MDVVSLIAGCFERNKKGVYVKVLAVLEYMFHGSCRKVSRVISLILGPISKSTVNDLARKVSSRLRIASEKRPRRCIIVDETKLMVKGRFVYIWSSIDADSGELLALEASFCRSSLNALKFLEKTLSKCVGKPKVIVDRGPWYLWALKRPGLGYEHQRFGPRNKVERFFRYLKERTIVFHNKLSARSYAQGVRNLNQLLNLFTIYYKIARQGGG